MATKRDIYKQALLHMGSDAAGLTTLTQNHAGRQQLDIAWAGVVAEAFNEGDWNFAKAAVALSVNVSATVALGFTVAFDYPADYERTIAVSSAPRFDQEFRDYVDEGGFLHANTDILYLRYISNAKQADGCIVKWPTMFWRYVALKLAVETCEKITGSSTKRESLERSLAISLRKAKSVDARNEPNKVIRSGDWLRARRGGGASSGVGNTVIGGEITFGEGDI